MKFIRMSSGAVFPDLRDEFGDGTGQSFPIPYRCDLTVHVDDGPSILLQACGHRPG